MHALEFRVPLFHEGLNVTVRLGEKYFHTLDAGDRILLSSRDARPQCRRAELIDVRMRVVSTIPNVWLKYEHDPACRTPDGLLEELKQVYGRDSVTSDSWVTLILFVPDPLPINWTQPVCPVPNFPEYPTPPFPGFPTWQACNGR